MPVRRIRCSAGHEYDALDSIGTHDPDLSRCPSCGSTDLERLIQGPPALRMPFDYDGRPAAEIEMALEEKRRFESASEEDRAGYRIPKGLPSWLQPETGRRFH